MNSFVAVEAAVVGDEAFQDEGAFDDGMTAVLNVEAVLIAQYGAGIVLVGGDFGQVGGDINLGDDGGIFPKGGLRLVRLDG